MQQMALLLSVVYQVLPEQASKASIIINACTCSKNRMTELPKTLLFLLVVDSR